MTVRLRDGRVLTAAANGARGYHERPASDEQLAAKFFSCATRVLPASRAEKALAVLHDIDAIDEVRTLTKLLA